MAGARRRLRREFSLVSQVPRLQHMSKMEKDMDQAGTIAHSTEAAPQSFDPDRCRRAVEFARSHIAVAQDADGNEATVEGRLAKWFDDLATTMKAPAVAHMIAGLDDAELDRLLNLCLGAARSSSGAIVKQMLAAVYAKTASERPLVDVEFNRYVDKVTEALDNIACAIAVLPRRQ